MAINDGDSEALRLLSKEHSYLIDKLNQAGLTTDADLLGLVGELNNQVGEVIAGIKEKRDDIGIKLRELVKRKEMVSAYVSAIYSVKLGQYKEQ